MSTEVMTEWGLRLVRLVADAEALLDPLVCREPGGVGGSQPGRHCAACCMGTMFATTCREEHDVAVALSEVIAAAKRLVAS